VALATAAGAGAGADAGAGAEQGFDLDGLTRQARALATRGAAWYGRTPPADRVAWGGLAAAATLGLGVFFERSLRLRHSKIIPREFTPRFLERLRDGELGRGKALDYCELNPSPASRVALAAVKRWGRPVTDLERAVVLAHRVEADRLRRNVGTLRRVAALTPLLGLLGTLVAVSRALAASGPAASWGPALANALGPITVGVAIATIALVVYDGLSGRVEYLVATLDRIGAETVDAIALALPLEPPQGHGQGPATASGPARTPHQVRIEVPKPRPKPAPRAPIDDDDYD
jgi:biopolymer transport protein ExbB